MTILSFQLWEGRPNKDEKILEALHSSLGLAAAQLVNIEGRLDLNETSTQGPHNPPELPSLGARVTYLPRSRLVQCAPDT